METDGIFMFMTRVSQNRREHVEIELSRNDPAAHWLIAAGERVRATHIEAFATANACQHAGARGGEHR